MQSIYATAVAFVVALSIIAGPVSAAASEETIVAQTVQQASTIQGHVTGSSVTGGIGGAVVILDGPAHASATTDPSGNFSLTVPAGEYTVTINKGGYQTGSTQVIATLGATETVNVELTESSLSNLQVIGRTSGSTGGNAAKFNISSSASVTLSQALIQQRNVPDLPKLVSSLPGIVASTNSSTNNSFFRMHGLGQETLVTIDGHPISSGVSGTFLGQFTQTGLLGGIDVIKGAGLNGPTAGESAVGTLNIRTPDYTSTNTGYFQTGVDNYGGTLYTGLVTFNLDKFSFVFGKSFSGYVGNFNNQTAYGITGTRPSATFSYQTPYLTNNNVGYSQPLTSPQELNSEIAKMRFRFSSATSLGFEFFGTQATLSPEGSAFGQFVGYATIPQCVAGGKAASGAGCTLTSSYNSPFLTGIAGQTNVPLYTFFPGTAISNNNPNFNLDFKTTIGNDTLLVRPYTAGITRLSDGSAATAIYGNGSTAQPSYEVTSNANCQVNFVAATAAAGAKGPCYLAGSVAGTPGFVNTVNGPTAYAVTTNATGITCTVAVPCFTSSTAQDNSGIWGFGTPAYTLEYDKLAGYTFSYIHPVGNNIYNFSVDHYYNDTTSYSGDLTPLVAGCAFTQAGGAAPASHADPGYQPNCGTTVLAGGYKATPLAIPETFSSVTSFALTAQLQLTPKLEFDFGNYFTFYRIYGQQESPDYLNAFGAAQVAAGDKVNLGLAPIVLSGFLNAAQHYDPHFGLVWRPTRDLSLRATAGSSIEVPYASLVSGLTSQSSVTNGYAFTVPNPNLLPEVVVAEDLGGDYRFKKGTVLSLDLFNVFVHNTWLQTQIAIPPPAGYATNVSYYQQINLNGSGRWSRGVEFTLANLPQRGFGYSLSGTVNRLNYVNLPASFLMLGTYTPDGAQDYGYPYTKGYLNLQYALGKDTLVRFGADYEGTNNSYNAPAYTQLDAGVRVAIVGGFSLQAAVENLNNVNFGALFAHAVYNQGQVPVNQTLNANGTFSYNNGPGRGLSAPFARTIRFSLIKRL